MEGGRSWREYDEIFLGPRHEAEDAIRRQSEWEEIDHHVEEERDAMDYDMAEAEKDF